MEFRSIPSFESDRSYTTESEQNEPTQEVSQSNTSRSRMPPSSVEMIIEVPELEDVDLPNKDMVHMHGSPTQWMYFSAPATAIMLWFVGLATAIVHGGFLCSLEGHIVGNQAWTLRYSLVIAFVFKSALAASISIALTQYIWFTLRKSEKGIHIKVIDAMFMSESSLRSLLSPALWRSATITGILASCVWLMPLSAIIAPTALAVGSQTSDIIRDDCQVPVLDWGIQRHDSLRALYVFHYSSFTFDTSITSERLVAAVLNTGQQIGWPSPCGPNCAYNIQFFGPSWQCSLAADNDDPRAPWGGKTIGSYWYGSDGPNTIVDSGNRARFVRDFSYNNVYYAGLNSTTNQFWVGFAHSANGSVYDFTLGKSLQQILGVQSYSCQFFNASYTMRVSYNNGIQLNTVLDVHPLATINVSSKGWDGSTINVTQEVVGLYLPMMKVLSGEIQWDPRSKMVYSTSLGLIPTLIEDDISNSSLRSETPYIPRSGLGPLLEELSHNLTISLMSIPSLTVIGSTVTSCHTTHTNVVWEVYWTPIIGAYSIALAVSLVCLALGAQALIANGGAYDTAFSSIVRTTRNEQLDRLVDYDDYGKLPLPPAIARQKLDFIDEKMLASVSNNGTRQRTGFRVHHDRDDSAA